MDDSKIIDKLVTARIALLLKHPFFGNLATRLKLVNANDWCPTAGTDGRHFFYNTKSEQFSHPSVLIFLGPSGKITRYLYGIVFDIFDFKLSLFESKKNKTLSTVESMLLFCYNYDPDEKGYVLEAVRLMKAAGLLTVLFLFIFIYKLSRNN